MTLLISLQRLRATGGYTALIRLRSNLIPLRTPHSGQQQSQKLHTNLDKSILPEWADFYNRARALCDKGSNRGPISLSQISRATAEETFNKIEEVENYKFPKDGDPMLHKACEALSDALQNAIRDEVEHDTDEVKQAFKNLQKEYDQAAESNTIPIRYINAELPAGPFSPLYLPAHQVVLSRPWMKELVTTLHPKSFPILVIGNPGAGKSVSLVGYLLFYLNALGIRVILQSVTGYSFGVIFDDNGVRLITDPRIYNDGNPCVLLVSADDPKEYPSNELSFCEETIVVSSPNVRKNPDLKEWKKQAEANEFIALPPSHHEVVYLLSKLEGYDSALIYWIYQEWSREFRGCDLDCEEATSNLKNGTLFQWYKEKTQTIEADARSMLNGGPTPGTPQFEDNLSYLRIPSSLATMERSDGQMDCFMFKFATQRIARIIAEIRRQGKWVYKLATLEMLFRTPETRVAAGYFLEDIFLQILRTKGTSGLPPCYELDGTDSLHPLPPLRDSRLTGTPWTTIGKQPTSKLEYISDGKGADGRSNAEMELELVMKQTLDRNTPSIRFLKPCARNWATWDIALIISSMEGEDKVVDIVFLQTTRQLDHKIHAGGLNEMRDAVPAELKNVRYHYVLVHLIDDLSDPTFVIPKYKDVLVSSGDEMKDSSWDGLREYIMFVTFDELMSMAEMTEIERQSTYRSF